MTFPVYFDVAGLHLHPHPVMEVIAYTGGFQLYLHLRRRRHPPATALPFEQNMWVIVGAILGALVGSKLLAIAENWPAYWSHRDSLATWLSGKTVVGGLLGGWAGVEIAKSRIGLRQSTGDLFVFPLIFGMAVGRIGCFLTGLSDHTYGIPTTLPWAVDFGDAIPRHPTQLYEVLYLLALAPVLLFCRRHLTANGQLFRWYVTAYLAMRFAIEFIKPTPRPYVGLSAIQLACCVGVIICARWLWAHPRPPALDPALHSTHLDT